MTLPSPPAGAPDAPGAVDGADASRTMSRAEYRRWLAAQVAAVAAAAAAATTTAAAATTAAPTPLDTPTSSTCDDRVGDEFARAARALGFTRAIPMPAGQTAPPVPDSPITAALGRAPRPQRARRIFRRIAAGSFSAGVMTAAALLALGATTPAAAVASAVVGATDAGVEAAADPTAKRDSAGIQAYVTSAQAAPVTLERNDKYEVASLADIAADSGVTAFADTWVNHPDAAIQWPFPVGVPISAAYGSVSYQSQFGRPHRGVDLTPGEGAAVHVIADGTVRIATEAGGDYGVTVVVDHVIDGQLVSTRYAHMLYGSLQVSPGQKVTVGQVLGRVGQTGKATGPHLHFEVLLGGSTHTDPMAWMYAHTAR